MSDTSAKTSESKVPSRIPTDSKDVEPSTQNLASLFYNKSTPLPWLPPAVFICWLSLGLIQLASDNLFWHIVLIAPFKTPGDVFGALSNAAGSLLGFSITAVTVFLAMPDENRLKAFAERKMLRPLFHNFLLGIASAAIALVSTFIGLCQPDVYSIQFATLWAFSMALAFLTQSVTILSDVGGSILSKLETDATAARAAKLRAIKDKLGPDGTV